MSTITLREFKFKLTGDRGGLAADFDDSGWSGVVIPHDWAITGPFDEQHDLQITAIEADGETREKRHSGRTGGLPHIGRGIYRCKLPLPASLAGRRVYVDFDGIMSHGEIFINGQLAGRRPYGYIPFEIDITGHLKADADNTLAVWVDNPGFASRWYPGAGIYRNARLHVLPETHIPPYGVRVTGDINTDGSADLTVRTDIRNCAAKLREVNIVCRVKDEAGHELSGSQTTLVGAGEQTMAVCRISMPAPRKWDIDDPYLYQMEVELTADGLTQKHPVNFGIRAMEFSADKGFVLNGRRLKFKGVCLHHDLGALGAAVNRRAIERQLALLRDMGCNAIRVTHNPAAPELLELCDRMGLLVIEEAFDEWRKGKVENGYHRLFDQWAERDLRAMIRRHVNHPCIMMWSIGNEIGEQHDADGYRLARFLRDICRREDPTRPVTAGLNVAEKAMGNGFAQALDVAGFNYKPEHYGLFRHMAPNLPMFGSETASTVSSRGVYHFPAAERLGPASADLQTSSYDLDTTGWSTTPDAEFRGQDENPSIMGEFVWTGIDYLGEPTPYGDAWPSRSSYFGIIDLAGIPKDRYYLYQSRWSDKPVLHLLPHWTWPERQGQATPVMCYTNFKKVELFVNGVSQGVRRKSIHQMLNRYRLFWPAVIYQPGTLRAVAYDDEGRMAMETVVETAGAPAGLRLEPDRTRITAGGDDLAFIRVAVVDAAGRVCPRADNEIAYSITGPARIAGICNGDPTSTQPFLADRQKVFNGQAVLILRSDRTAKTGAVRITATARELAPADAALHVTAG